MNILTTNITYKTELQVDSRGHMINILLSEKSEQNQHDTETLVWAWLCIDVTENLSVLTPLSLIISHITVATAANNVSSCLPAALFQLTYLLELLPSSFGPLLLFSTLLLLAGDLNKANNTAYIVNAIYNKKLRR